MRNLIIHSLDWLARLCYLAGRSRHIKLGLFILCALAFGALVWLRTARTNDYTVYPLSPRYIKATLVNRYVKATGSLLYEGAYDVRSPLLGIFWQNVRFIPMSISGSNESLEVLDAGLPPRPVARNPVTLVGKILIGEDQYPDYYLRVADPPNPALYDALAWLCVVVIGGVLLGVAVNWMVRRVDYAINTPFGMLNTADWHASAPFVLWFGSLGAGYADVVLRQVPVSFKAIPAEARLTPTGQPDSWAVIIRRLRVVQATTVATTYGALPAMRMEFEDERGITRNGLVAASDGSLMSKMLDVLRFVGQ